MKFVNKSHCRMLFYNLIRESSIVGDRTDGAARDLCYFIRLTIKRGGFRLN